MVAANLVNTERRMLKAMQSQSTKVWALSEILDECDWQDQAIAVGAGLGLADKGMVEISETITTEVRLGVQGQLALSEGLLEARLWDWFKSSDEPSMANIQQAFERHEAGPGIGLLKKLGLVVADGIFVCDNESQVNEAILARQDFLTNLPASVTDLDGDMLTHFKNRRNFIEFIDSTTRTWTLTTEGEELDSSLLIETTMVNESLLNCYKARRGKKPSLDGLM